MPTGKPITLYVPFYNAHACAQQVVAAIRGQTRPPDRVLFIDDYSQPPLQLAGVEILRHPANCGLAAARNSALGLCQTPRIAALDADVVPEPGWLAALEAALDQEPATGAGGALRERFDQDLGDRWRSVHMAQHWGATRLRNPRFLFGSNTLFDAEALRAAGGYDERCRTNNEDRLMSEALYAAGHTLVYEPAARCAHLRRDTAKSILAGYWRWHHARGLLQGDFDTPAGLLRRVDAVNFGIFRYRFDLDAAAGRTELLGLDAALPWVFCALDLALFRDRTGTPLSAFPTPDMLAAWPLPARRMVPRLLPDWPAFDTAPAWFPDYLAETQRAAESRGWFRSAEDDTIKTPSILRFHGFC